MNGYANEFALREAVAAALLADPEASDREIARRTGTSHPTVAKVRRLINEGSYEQAPDRSAWVQLVQMYAARVIRCRDLREENERLRAELTRSKTLPG